MKRHTGLCLIVTLLGGVASVACSDDGPKGGSSPDVSSSGSSESSGPTGSDTSSASTSATVTGSTTTSGGTGGTGGTGGSTSSGDTATSSDTNAPTCEVPAFSVFPRSDTEDSWDDNDFDSVVTEVACPFVVNVTWPHEEGWENADPAEANFEQVHFTLETYYSLDLTGKQLNMTIELVEDERSPEATAGGYVVSLVSVSSYTYEVEQEPEPVEVDDAGVDDASVDAGAVSADPGDDVPPTTVTMTGYSEAESPAAERLVLREAGDRATIRFALPNKTSEISSYDPASVIKINARIYNLIDAPPTVVEPGGGDITEDVSSSDVDTGSASSSATSSADSSSVTSESSSSALESTSSAAESTSSSGPKPTVYGYLTSKFAITSFTVTDAN